jgi:hypothetical protein
MGVSDAENAVRPLRKFFNYFFSKLWPTPLFLFWAHKKCITSHFIHNSTAMFP